MPSTEEYAANAAERQMVLQATREYFAAGETKRVALARKAEMEKWAGDIVRQFADAGIIDPPAPEPEPHAPKVESPYLTLNEAVEYTGLSAGTIYNALYSGRLTKQPGTRRVLIHRDDLDKYIKTAPPKKRKKR